MADYIDIYSLNDFHGAIFENKNQPGISRLGNFLINKKQEYPEGTIIISSGDMFQGTAASNMTKGDIVVEAMNIIGFDAMTIGNHEFDWGIFELKRLCDGCLDNMEANFPILAANILHKDTRLPVTWAKPYTVLEKCGLKIGIIGLIGETLINDILGSVIKDYIFDSQMATIKKFSKVLREEGCDIVIVATHSDTAALNKNIAYLPVDQKIDAVFNGHTHQYYAGEVFGDCDVPLPFIQSGNNGRFIGNIRLYFNKETKEVTSVMCRNLDAAVSCMEENAVINNMLQKYESYRMAENEVLAFADQEITRSKATVWAADVLGGVLEGGIGLLNNGAIRSVAFPIKSGETITYGLIFQMMPFENKVVIVKLEGAYILELCKHVKKNKITFSANLDIAKKTINKKKIKKEKLYNVITIDFVFESPFYFMEYEDNGRYTDILYRDLLVTAVRDAALERNGKWNI